MRFIANIIEKLQRHPKRVVFPEGEEPRILQAARQFSALRLGAPIVLGDTEKIKDVAEGMNISLEGIRIINPAESEDLDNFAHRFELLRRSKGIKAREAREMGTRARARKIDRRERGHDEHDRKQRHHRQAP